MRDNPFHGFVLLVTGATPDLVALGPWRWLLVAVFVGLFVGGLGVAAANWLRDPEQRTAGHLLAFLSRFALAGMWFVGCLWKLPFPVSGGFRYWLEQTVKGSSFQWHADVMQVFLDHVALVQPVIFTLELAIAASLMLGLFVRAFGTLGALFILNLWIGLYNASGEWPWTYIAIVCAHGMFVAAHAGRSLGLDAVIARAVRPAYGYIEPLPRFARALG